MRKIPRRPIGLVCARTPPPRDRLACRWRCRSRPRQKSRALALRSAGANLGQAAFEEMGSCRSIPAPAHVRAGVIFEYTQCLQFATRFGSESWKKSFRKPRSRSLGRPSRLYERPTRLVSDNQRFIRKIRKNRRFSCGLVGTHLSFHFLPLAFPVLGKKK